MADIPLTPIRIGFPYVVGLDFPVGFLQAGEGVRTKLRRWVGDVPITPLDTRVGDSITLELDETQTGAMQPGVYYAEMEIYETATPAVEGVIMTDNRYLFNCQHSVSE